MPDKVSYLPPSPITVRPSDLLKTDHTVGPADDAVIPADRFAQKLKGRKRAATPDAPPSPDTPRKRARREAATGLPPTPYPALITMAMQHTDVDTMCTLGKQLTALQSHLGDAQAVRLWSLYANSYLRGYVVQDRGIIAQMAHALVRGLSIALPADEVLDFQKALLQVYEVTGGLQGLTALDLQAYAKGLGDKEALRFMTLMPQYFLSPAVGVATGLGSILLGLQSHASFEVSAGAAAMFQSQRLHLKVQQVYAKLGGVPIRNLENATARLFNVHVPGVTDEGESLASVRENMSSLYHALVTSSPNPITSARIFKARGVLDMFSYIAGRDDVRKYIDIDPPADSKWDERVDAQGNHTGGKFDINDIPIHLSLGGPDGSHAIGMRINTEVKRGVAVVVFNTGYATNFYHQKSVMRLKSQTNLPDPKKWKREQISGNCTPKSYRMIEADVIGPEAYHQLQHGRRYMAAMSLETKLVEHKGGIDDYLSREVLRQVREKVSKRLLPKQDAQVSYTNSQFRIEGFPEKKLFALVDNLMSVVETPSRSMQDAFIKFYGQLGAQTDAAKLQDVAGISKEYADMVANALVKVGYAVELGPPNARKLHLTEHFVDTVLQNPEMAEERLDQELLFSAFGPLDDVLDSVVTHLIDQAGEHGYLVLSPYPGDKSMPR